MSFGPDFELLKQKKLDKNAHLKMSRNIMSGRIFVEFSSQAPRLTLQKNFQDTREGKAMANEFAKSIKNTDQLLEYFGIKK